MFKFIRIYFIILILFCTAYVNADINSDLKDACKKADLQKIIILIKKGANINNKDSSGNTPLHYAVESANFDIVKYLIEKGAKVDNKNAWGITPLEYAIKTSNLDIIKYLVEKGANVNNKNAFGETVFYYAVQEANLEIIKYLTEKGANINEKNKDGFPFLTIALKNKKIDLVKCLVENGIDINISDKYDRTPLHFAIINKSDEIDLDLIKYLIGKGAIINKKGNEGKSVLMIAIEKNFFDLAKFLVEKGADVNETDQYGNTSLYYAVESADIDMIKYLVENKANVSYKNNSGDNILKSMIKMNFDNNYYKKKEIEKYLKSKIYNSRWVIADSGLRMRDAPDERGNKIDTIPYNSEVVLLEEIGDVVKISDVIGKWSKVEWNAKKGWVFGGFLVKIKGLDLLVNVPKEWALSKSDKNYNNLIDCKWELKLHPEGISDDSEPGILYSTIMDSYYYEITSIEKDNSIIIITCNNYIPESESKIIFKYNGKDRIITDFGIFE